MIILVAGLPGSGKSYFAERIADRLDAVHINSDRVRLELHASGKYSLADKLLVYKEMLLRTTVALEQKKDVVVDATFYHHTMREMFLRLAEGYHVVTHVVEVVAEEALIKQRLQKPRTYSEADYSVYEIVRDGFEEITMPHLTLESTDSNIDEMLKKAESYIGRDRE